MEASRVSSVAAGPLLHDACSCGEQGRRQHEKKAENRSAAGWYCKLRAIFHSREIFARSTFSTLGDVRRSAFLSHYGAPLRVTTAAEAFPFAAPPLVFKKTTHKRIAISLFPLTQQSKSTMSALTSASAHLLAMPTLVRSLFSQVAVDLPWAYRRTAPPFLGSQCIALLRAGSLGRPLCIY